MSEIEQEPAGRQVGRYVLLSELAAGGMATVHIGRLMGPVGFARTVAIKRLHAQFAKDPEFVSMFLDEARLAARIRHPNVVPSSTSWRRAESSFSSWTSSSASRCRGCPGSRRPREHRSSSRSSLR